MSEYKFPSDYMPDWDSPEVSEFDYRAIDADGRVFYYKDKPVFKQHFHAWDIGDGHRDCFCVGKVGLNYSTTHWRNSLEARPGINQTDNE